MVGWPQRRGADELGTLEARPGQVIERQVQVLRAGFRVGGHAAVAALADRGQRLARAEMDDVDRHSGQLGQRDRPVRGLAFHRRRAGQAVIDRRGLALGKVALDQHVDRAAVLGVHHDQAAVVRGAAQRAEDRRVVQHEHARVGHEQLERRDAAADHRVHLAQDLLVDLADDEVQPVVDVRFRACLLQPPVQALGQALAVALHREVDDRGRAAPGGGRGAGGEVVGRERPTERELHVGMHIDPARHHVPVRRVDDHVGLAEPGADRPDLLAVDQHVGPGHVGGRDHGPVLDQRCHGSCAASSP